MCGMINSLDISLYKESFKSLFIHLRVRESEHERASREGGGRGRRESQADSLLSTEPFMGLDPGTLRS